MNKKIITVISMALAAASLSFAKPVADGSLKAPGKDKVILVGKISANPTNLEARRSGLVGTAKLKTKVYDETLAAFGFDGQYMQKGFAAINKSALGEYCYVTAKVNEGKVTINRCAAKLFPQINPWYFFTLPIDVTVAIPEDAEYVYIGDFTYTLDAYLTPTKVEHFDTYKAAQEDVNRATGKDVQLYRGALTFNK